MFGTVSGGSWTNAVFDEIALEGLDGTTLPSLWILLARRLQCGSQLSGQLQQQIWMLLLRSTDKVNFYELPAERLLMPPYDRSNDLDSDVGLPVVPKTWPFLCLPFVPVQDGHIMGNCSDYNTRKAIDVNVLKELTAAEATERWQQTLVVVASQEQRVMALKPPNVLEPKDLSVQQFIFWECIGRSRYNGETTAGPWSLTHYFKDASYIFYMKNKFLHHQLVACQPYTERYNDRTICSMLVMLPRFFRIYKSHLQRVIEKLYIEIKQRPDQQMPTVEISDHLKDLKSSQVKKLLVAHNFRRIFETTQLMLPPTGDSAAKDPTKIRKVTVLRLRNPDLKFEELSQTEGNSNDAKEDLALTEFVSPRRAYIDMPLELECLRAIMRFGTRGMSVIEMAHYVAINWQTARNCMKYLLREHQVKGYTEHVAKTRIVRYVAGSQAAAAVDLKQELLEITAQQLHCQEEPNIPQNVNIKLNDDLPEITANLRQMTLALKKRNKVQKETPRQVRRKTLIVHQIDKRCIIHSMDLMIAITQAEQKFGFREKICRKSLYRLLQRMDLEGIIHVYEVTLQYQQRLRLYRLVTHPKIDMQHEQLQRELLRLKSNFHLVTEERKSRPCQSLSNGERKELLARKKQRLEQERQGATGTAGATGRGTGIPKPSSPKLLLARTLHEFFFYLVCEQQRDQKPLEMNAELLQHWQRTEPSLLARQYLDEWLATESHVLPYTQEINWRSFIPPLPIYDEKPSGWLYFMDALERMPLSLVMRIFRIERDAMEQLRPQLQHPVRQHYLLRQLQLQNLIPRLRLQQLYVATLRLLNNMGLVQVSDRQFGRDSLQRWVYLNRRSCLLDTTTSSGHNYNRISSERTYEQLQFEFENREHIADYWAKLQHVCIYTKLGFLKHKKAQIGNSKEVRIPPLTFVNIVSDFAEAQDLDDGSVPGDRQGAAGLSSTLFAHQFRHWSWVKRTTTAASKSTTTTATSSTLPARKRLSLMRLKPVPKIQLRKARGANSQIAAKRNRGPRDDIDRDALRNMRTLRVTWTVTEDRLLKMGRAVYLFIDVPLPALALFNVGTICRDVIRQYLGICNKTTQACVRRLQFLIRMKRDLPDVPSWIYTMQTQPQFNTVYNERFLTELKREYPSRSEQNDAILVHFVIILSRLHRLVNNTDTVPRQFLVPDNLEDYQRQFRECMPLNADMDQVLYTNPSTETELQVIVALGVLHSILCCGKDKTLFNLQAFEIYKHFSEDVLNAAFNKARTDSLLVAIKRRNIQAVSRQISGPAHLLSSKYKYRLICQKLGHALYDAYYAFEQQFHGPEPLASHKLSSPTFAQLLLMSEWLVNRRLSLTLQLPVNILTVDTSSMSRQSGTATDRILDHYSSIFDNAPQTEYSKRLETEVSSGRQAVRVRFHPANLTYRLQCSAYNQLSKLPLRAMHFFCALDALGQSVNISYARVELGECPFGCIMRSGNYLNAVERIVYEHRAVLRQLVADALPQTHLQLQLDNSTACSTTLTVTTGNLLTLVQQLEAFWRQHQHPQERKDLGKALAERTLHKLADWRSLCNGLLDVEAGKQETEHSQDYEPSLNKEERARAQDVFVVHLPTLSLQETEQQFQQAEQDNLRKAVLEKVAKVTYFRYTEHNFETLRPTLIAKSYDTSAIQHMEEILGYIEQRPLGVVGTELRRTFPFGKFLLDALHELEGHDLIKRVGVASRMYVHKAHMRHWVVHTFNIKRLERERVQTLVAAAPATPQAVVGQKRKQAEQEMEQQQEHEQEELPSTSKQAKLSTAERNSSEDDESLPKRSKRIVSNEEQPVATPTLNTEATRDVIVMRPQPWIRVNASLNRRVLDRWLSAVLSECITRTGCTVHSLFMRFPHLLPVDTMLLLELLTDLGCIHLMELDPPKVHVENTYDEEFKEQQVTELYEPTYTYVRANSDAIGRLTGFIGLKKYSTEFI